jgi:hypothetical protein
MKKRKCIDNIIKLYSAINFNPSPDTKIICKCCNAQRIKFLIKLTSKYEIKGEHPIIYFTSIILLEAVRSKKNTFIKKNIIIKDICFKNENNVSSSSRTDDYNYLYDISCCSADNRSSSNCNSGFSSSSKSCSNSCSSSNSDSSSSSNSDSSSSSNSDSNSDSCSILNYSSANNSYSLNSIINKGIEKKIAIAIKNFLLSPCYFKIFYDNNNELKVILDVAPFNVEPIFNVVKMKCKYKFSSQSSSSQSSSSQSSSSQSSSSQSSSSQSSSSYDSSSCNTSSYNTSSVKINKSIKMFMFIHILLLIILLFYSPMYNLFKKSIKNESDSLIRLLQIKNINNPNDTLKNLIGSELKLDNFLPMLSSYNETNDNSNNKSLVYFQMENNNLQK